MPMQGPSDRASLLRLLEVARQLAAPSDLTDLLEQIINAGREVLGADRASVFLFDPETKELFIKIGTNLDELRFSIDKGIAGECACTRKIINVPDCYDDPRFNPEVDHRTGYHTCCLIAVPLIGLEDQLVGVLQLLNPTKGCFDEADEQIAAGIAAQAAVAVQRARLMDERMVKLKLERDLQLARQIQLDVLPKHLPQVRNYDLAAFSQPAEQTGGDIYDLIPIAASERNGEAATSLLILLADATGHGIGPALSVTQVRAMIRLGVRLDAGLDDLLAHVNNQLNADLAGNRFVTAFVGRLDTLRHTLTYHAAGQGPLLHLHAGTGDCEWRSASTLPMGVLADPPLDRPEPIVFDAGDVHALLTDGIYEYQNAEGEQFGKERVGEVIKQNADRSAQQILDALIGELRRFAGAAPQLDDLTAVIVKRSG